MAELQPRVVSGQACPSYRSLFSRFCLSLSVHPLCCWTLFRSSQFETVYARTPLTMKRVSRILHTSGSQLWPQVTTSHFFFCIRTLTSQGLTVQIQSIELEPPTKLNTISNQSQSDPMQVLKNSIIQSCCFLHVVSKHKCRVQTPGLVDLPI